MLNFYAVSEAVSTNQDPPIIGLVLTTIFIFVIFYFCFIRQGANKKQKATSSQNNEYNPEQAVQKAKKVGLALMCIGAFVTIIGVGHEFKFGAILLLVVGVLIYFGARPIAVRKEDESFNNWPYIQPDDNRVNMDGMSWVDGMDGHEFEHFCAELLRKNGFYDVSVTKGSGDQGVDVLATKGGIKYAIQCKNYVSALGNTPVQEVNAGKTFYNCHVGVVMTNSRFTISAVELARATGVLLWDRDVLQSLISGTVRL